ncbi:uncharacterized protein LOC116111202 [Pistacia vera]|uniref:uncharacterized protein LOC116111202 n=1 Tax=Pistacia vera TaxID=55513 RepID=UPI001262F5A0|nr:uncharacterized protein LOC116111202 [Pistacia vera]
MIKRRFYRLEHADTNDAADSSSSSDSDSELEGQATEESEDDAVAEVNGNDESCSTSSGYEREDSSADEINVDSSAEGIFHGLMVDIRIITSWITQERQNLLSFLEHSDGTGALNEDDAEIGNDEEIFVDNQLSSKQGAEVTKSNTIAEKASMAAGVPDCLLQIKSVFRCRICPRIICLTEETLRAHLNSKRHARSDKLLKEHRLKSILNDDGEIENQETAGELHARIVALAENTEKNKNKNKRRHRKRNLSSKENTNEKSITKKAKQLIESPAKKRRKGEN